MSEQAQNSNQQTIVIALVVIAALLAAIVGVLVWQQSQAAQLPAPTAASGAAATSGAASSSGAAASTGQVPPGMAQQAAPPAAFDSKTATKLPAGMTPEQAVKTYNEDVIGGKYAEAYKLLPADKQASYGSASAYEQQVKAYGITSYKIGATQGSGNDVAIAATQVTPQMPITYTWNFKKVGNQWYVASRVMGGTAP